MPTYKGNRHDDKFQKVPRNTLSEIHHKQSYPKQNKTDRKDACSKHGDGNPESQGIMGERAANSADCGNSSSGSSAIQKKVKEKYLTISKLKYLFCYSEISGKLVRRITVSSNAKAGDIVGSLSKTDGYLYVRIDGYRYAVHRLIWLFEHGEFPKIDIDHINHNKTDNRIQNLRDVSNRENHQNREKKNLSGCTGVNWDKGKNRWRSQVSILGKTRCIGIYKDKASAIVSRESVDKVLLICAVEGVSL